MTKIQNLKNKEHWKKDLDFRIHIEIKFMNKWTSVLKIKKYSLRTRKGSRLGQCLSQTLRI